MRHGKSKTCAILEIDEGSVAMHVFQRRGRRVAITQSAVEPFSISDSKGRGRAIGSVAAEIALEDDVPLHVVLADRRFVHTRIDVPQAHANRAVEIASREARQIASLPTDVPVLASCRFVRRLSSRRIRFAVVALPLPAWQGVESDLLTANLRAATLTSCEDAVSVSTRTDDPDDSPWGIIDPGPGRVRFVYCEDGVVRQSRRIRMPGWTDDGEGAIDSMASAHLALEIPRTLEFLSTQGLATPRRIVVGHRLHIDDAQMTDAIDGACALQSFAAEESAWITRKPGAAVSVATVPLATLGLARRFADQTFPSILPDAGTPAVPRSRLRVAAAATMTGILLASGTAGVVWHRAAADVRSEIADIDRRTRAAFARTGHGDTPTLEVEGPDRVTTLLGARRPFSLAAGSILASAPESVTLQSIDLDGHHGLGIEGIVLGRDRRTRLLELAEFVSSLRDLDFFAEVRESVGHAAQTGLEFSIVAHWRAP